MKIILCIIIGFAFLEGSKINADDVSELKERLHGRQLGPGDPDECRTGPAPINDDKHCKGGEHVDTIQSVCYTDNQKCSDVSFGCPPGCICPCSCVYYDDCNDNNYPSDCKQYGWEDNSNFIRNINCGGDDYGIECGPNNNVQTKLSPPKVGFCESCIDGSTPPCLTKKPTSKPTKKPIKCKTESPTDSPTESPTDSPTESPTESPTDSPTDSPTESPTDSPTESPTDSPTDSPTESPTDSPTDSPTESPTNSPTDSPTDSPTESPTKSPTRSPIQCSQPMDVGLIMDRSNSIFKGGLEKTRQFVTNMVDNFDLSPNGAEFSLIQFNGAITGLLPFSYDRNKIIAAGNKLGASKGSTFTGGAIKYFTDNYLEDSRDYTSKYLVLITDGEPTKGIRSPKTSPIQYTFEQVERMRVLYPEVVIISIGLGGFDKNFLDTISDKDSQGNPLVYSINTIIDLDDILYRLTSIMCTHGSFTRRPTVKPTVTPTSSLTTCSENCEYMGNPKVCRKNECGCIWNRRSKSAKCKLKTFSPTSAL